jgi:serine protease Do
MDDILLLEATERYLKGDLSPEDKAHFEELRKNNPEVDQLVVEHAIFLHQIETFGETRDFKHTLHETHYNLLLNGQIKESNADEKEGKVIQLWKKYKRVTGIAASIAGLTALVISGLVTYFTPVANKNEIRELGRQVRVLNHNLKVQGNQINEIKSKAPLDERPVNGGTSFLIDRKGYLITNAHVVKGSSTIIVLNNKGQEFKARIAYVNKDKDIAFLKIEDEDYKPVATLPYSIKKGNIDLGEQIFTPGFSKG